MTWRRTRKPPGPQGHDPEECVVQARKLTYASLKGVGAELSAVTVAAVLGYGKPVNYIWENGGRTVLVTFAPWNPDPEARSSR